MGMIVSPAGFNILQGPNNYQFTIDPIGNFGGGLVQFLISGATKEGQLCTYKIQISGLWDYLQLIMVQVLNLRCSIRCFLCSCLANARNKNVRTTLLVRIGVVYKLNH